MKQEIGWTPPVDVDDDKVTKLKQELADLDRELKENPGTFYSEAVRDRISEVERRIGRLAVKQSKQ